MNVISIGLGYRELSKLADFIRKIENGNNLLYVIEKRYNAVNITYSLEEDEAVVIGIDNVNIIDIYKEEEFFKH